MVKDLGLKSADDDDGGGGNANEDRISVPSRPTCLHVVLSLNITTLDSPAVANDNH